VNALADPRPRAEAKIVRRLQTFCLTTGLMFAFGASAALAAIIPTPEALERQSGTRPVTLTVVEPHLSTPNNPVEVTYLVFQAPVALAAALGPNWAARPKVIEFHALDGYVSRIDVARLTSGKAYFAFARADHSPFTADNLAQNEKNVPLGPYYLVWDNRSDPKLLAAGAHDWPVLEPSAVKPDTKMPALSPRLPEAERRAIVDSIYKYLSQVPVVPGP